MMNSDLGTDTAVSDEQLTTEKTEETHTITCGGGKEHLTPDQIRAMINMPAYTHISDYDEVHTIGIGGTGAVYSANERELNRKLALKILRPSFRLDDERVRAIIREARSTAQIEHPNIVPVHRLGYFEDAGIYFSMKRVYGDTLSTILKKLELNKAGYRRKYTLNRLLDIFVGACRGVSYAHHNGLIHCDLKPQNLMVGDFGEVWVMDWGMARYIPKLDTEGNRVLAESHKGFSSVGGTLVFMAPELAGRTVNEPGIATDVYSLGCILYTILTWKKAPFNPEGTQEEVQKRVVQTSVVPPHRIAPKSREIPRELEAICLKAMSKKPSERYRNVDKLIEDIQAYRDNRPVKAYSPSWFYIFGKMLSRYPAIPFTLLLALGCWLIFAIYSTTQLRIEERAQRELAMQNFQNGENRLLTIRRMMAQLNDSRNFNETRKTEARIEAEIAEARNAYNSALEFLSRMPEYSWKKPGTVMIVRKIFFDLAQLHIARNDDRELYKLAEVFTYRWGRLFDAASAGDLLLQRQKRKILQNRGRLLIVANMEQQEPPQLFSRNRQTISPSGIRKEGKFVIYEYILHCGSYRFRTVLRNGSESRGPVQVGNTRVSMLSLIEPEKIPEKMVFIPGGLFRYSTHLNRRTSNVTVFSSFLIRQTEVTIGEYLQFWRTLPEDKKIDYAGYYTRANDTLYTKPLWDNQGRLQLPSLTENHPVTGISAAAAAAYCRYLSEKLKMNVMLPTQGQWLKAAYGTDIDEEELKEFSEKTDDSEKFLSTHPVGRHKGDVSAYGVLDMFGNVREFVRLSGFKGKHYGVIGGSYATPAELRGRQELIVSGRGSNETGFRYIISIPDSGKFQQFL